MNKRFLWIMVIFIAVYFILQIVSNYYLDYRWFVINNYENVFWILLLTKFNVHGIFSVSFTAIFFLNFLLMYLLGGKGRIFAKNILDKIKLPVSISTRKFLLILIAAGVVIIGFIMGLSASVYWKEYISYMHAVPFISLPKDPIFSMDAGFYVFSLPFYKFLYNWLMTTLVIITIFSVVFHILNGGICLQEQKLDFSLFSRTHLSILLALIVLLLGIGYRISAYDLLFSNRTSFFGAGYTADNAERIMYNICMIISFIGSGLLLVNIFKKSFKLPVIILLTLIPAYFILGTIFPSIQQRFIVEPNEMAMEKPYIENNIKFTRLAYDIDKVNEKNFANNSSLTYKDLIKNKNSIDNIRLWDWRPLKQTYKQLQGLKPYYVFNDVDVDRYEIDGNKVAVNLSARELDIDNLGGGSQTWINKHLVYTHGYGLVLSRVDKITTEGLPAMLIYDIPPKFGFKAEITKPQIYYGEHNNPYVITNSQISPGEFDYPYGDKNSYTTYSGTGGDKLDSFLKKFFYAVAFNDINMLISSLITDESRVLFRRNIYEMISQLTPFLEFDDDPYIVIADGRLFWIIDAYTTSDKFPYSTPIEIHRGPINYIRNSVKMVIDAYNGKIDCYISDTNDPIIKTYANIFTGLFKDISTAPEYIKPHFRYPESIFNIKAQMLLRYHMKNANVFYNNEDRWDIPGQVYENRQEKIHSYYLVTTLPGEKSSDFVLTIPFTPYNKDNMIAFLTAKCDPANYGEMTLYALPKDKLSYGPMQIEARIDQDPEISKQLTLWSQKGSSIIRGNMLVIPVEESLLFIEPLYLKAESGEMPELKRVILSFSDKIVMEKDLKTALETIFMGGSSFSQSMFA
ncbi:MAG: UPF0182 family protein, partial [Spirochaetes bacterium]|nr:UPF0182 family protein [Spirochaetota bacterium]